MFFVSIKVVTYIKCLDTSNPINESCIVVVRDEVVPRLVIITIIIDTVRAL